MGKKTFTQYAFIVGLLVLAVAAAMLVKLVPGGGQGYENPAGRARHAQDAKNTVPAALPKSAPVRLSIPAIHVDTSFVELGVDEYRQIEVPETTEEVGWYKYGPTPGELGPAVILGHVDSYEGPAVFYSLGQVSPGDLVEVERADGSVAHFRVDSLERYPQSDFPTSLVYGDIGHAGLRLITCSGSYDRNLRRYDHNLIVYASLVED